ncbi:MAG: hypothetical protein M1833_004345 [Piccolia ochrophora]|nr:MAG: hypothetical protein M1833_004345 [Piccolia ochrophora]
MDQPTLNGSNPLPPNAWQHPGPAAFDFRSDVVTTPTASMLAAITNTTLLDDVFVEDPTTTSLEAHIASLTAHPAGLLVLSGTMGNQVALRTHLAAPPHGILADARSHILEWEAGGVASLSGALAKPIHPANGTHLTLADIKQHVVLSDDVHACPTRVIALENTLGGAILPLADVRAISAFAREHAIKLHLDGARLWEAVAAGAGPLDEYTTLCDSVSVCFSKGLGAPIGSMLVGDEPFIKRARHVRKAIGGGLRQAGVVSAAARIAVDETFLGGRLAGSHEMAKRVAGAWEELGGRLEREVETNMVWLDLEGSRVREEMFIEAAKRRGVRVMGGRLVVHYQIGEEAVERLKDCMAEVVKGVDEKLHDVEGGEERVGRKAYGT